MVEIPSLDPSQKPSTVLVVIIFFTVMISLWESSLKNMLHEAAKVTNFIKYHTLGFNDK
jgi:hypothetical protein